MNKQVIQKLANLANHLDQKGFYKEAQEVDAILNEMTGKILPTTGNLLNNLNELKINMIRWETEVKKFRTEVGSKDIQRITNASAAMRTFINDEVQIALGPTGTIGALNKDFGELKIFIDQKLQEINKGVQEQQQTAQQRGTV